MHEHELLRRLFDQAAELKDDQRARFLAAACGGDQGLRQRLDELLAAHDDEHFLGDPTAVPATARERQGGEGVGSVVGPYTLLRELGEGGFGVVYLAAQQQPVARQVALKVLKPGMDTRQIVGRFEHERQALARMDHPHIARVLDAGATPGGRPFFVMDFVDGEPFVDHCDRQQLPLRARLELFLQVCDAVQHAHGRGVLHRDLKPSNVLVATVDGRALVKVIDFGIAKAIAGRDEHTALTEAQQVLGTLHYMSPEQAAGAGDLDVRSDVFSLGAMLYELLTGSTPFAIEPEAPLGFAELQRRIRELEPPLPSRRLPTGGERATAIASARRTTVQRLPSQLRGELDWIVMTALAKERHRRYATVHALADDLRRHLAGDPVTAAPPSRSYRLRKFVRNHRWQVAATAALLLSLAGGAGAFAWQADEARHERDRAQSAELAERSARSEAERQRERAQQEAAAAVLAREQAVAARDQANRARDQADIARDQAEASKRLLLDALQASDPFFGGTTDVSVRTAMLQAVQRLDAGALAKQPHSEVELRSTIAWLLLGDERHLDTALAVARRGLALARTLGPEHRRQLVRALGATAVVEVRLGHTEPAAALFAEALACEQTAEPNGSTMAASLSASLARTHLEAGDPVSAEAPAEASVSLHRRLQSPADELGIALRTLATVHNERGRSPRARELANEALVCMRRVHPGDHVEVALTLRELAHAELRTGDVEAGLQHHEDAVAMVQRLYGPGERLAVDLHDLGVALWSVGLADRAEARFTEALAMLRTVHTGDHRLVARNLKNLGSACRVLGKKQDAERVLQESVAMWQRLHPGGHPEFAEALAGLAVLHRDGGQAERGLDEAERALAMRRRLLGDTHPEVARTWFLVGQLQSQQKNAPAAATAFATALPLFERLHGGDHAEVVALHKSLADAQLEGKQFADAIPHYAAAIAMQQRLGGNEPLVAWCGAGLAFAREGAGDTVGARTAYDDALARLVKVAPNGSSFRARVLWRSGRARLDGGDAAAALPELEQAMAMAEKVLPAGHAHRDEYAATLRTCREQLAR